MNLQKDEFNLKLPTLSFRCYNFHQNEANNRSKEILVNISNYWKLTGYYCLLATNRRKTKYCNTQNGYACSPEGCLPEKSVSSFLILEIKHTYFIILH